MTVEGVAVASIDITRLNEDIVASERSGDHVTVESNTEEVHSQSQ